MRAPLPPQGQALLDEGYPAIHTVGRASSRPPALADLRWQHQGGAAGGWHAVCWLLILVSSQGPARHCCSAPTHEAQAAATVPQQTLFY